jgi:hypothetical protein
VKWCLLVIAFLATALVSGCGASGSAPAVMPAQGGFTLSPASSQSQPLVLSFNNPNQLITVSDPGYGGTITAQNSACFRAYQQTRTTFTVGAVNSLCKHLFSGTVGFSDSQGRSATAYFEGQF